MLTLFHRHRGWTRVWRFLSSLFTRTSLHGTRTCICRVNKCSYSLFGLKTFFLLPFRCNLVHEGYMWMYVFCVLAKIMIKPLSRHSLFTKLGRVGFHLLFIRVTVLVSETPAQRRGTGSCLHSSLSGLPLPHPMQRLCQVFKLLFGG